MKSIFAILIINKIKIKLSVFTQFPHPYKTFNIQTKINLNQKPYDLF